MHVSNSALVLFVLAAFIGSTPGPATAQKKAPQQVALLKIDKKYEAKTVVKKSTIPGAGNGLFAGVKIKKGEVIGQLGGRLIAADDYPQGNHYVATIPECAREETRPYVYIDSKDDGGHVSRINFAPSKINGRDTEFQNAAIKQLCVHPYFIFVALKDIEPGTEIWSSYGPHYDYGRFMNIPEVRDFFCGLRKIDCRERYAYSY
jgi:SET domain-containing protein